MLGFLWEADGTETADHKCATTSFAVAHSMGHSVNTLSRAVEAQRQVAPVKSAFQMFDPCNKVAYCLPDIPLFL